MAADMGVGAVGMKVAVEVFKHVVPSGLAYVSTWIQGNEILVLGQARAGKTTFIDYLRSCFKILTPIVSARAESC